MKKDDLLKFYLQYRYYLFPAVVVLSSLFLILFVIYPQTVKLINNQKSIGDLTDKSKFLETKVVALESYNEEDLSQKVKYTLIALPANKDLIDVLMTLQKMAAESGFSITSINLGNTSNKIGNANSFTVKMEMRGAEVPFQILLDSLENFPRLVRVSTIDISGQTPQAMNVALEVEALYSQLPQNLGTLDSPLPDISQKDEESIAVLMRSIIVTVPQPESIPLTPRGKVNPFE